MGLFTSDKTVNPMADEAGRVQLLAALMSADSGRALREITSLLKSVSAATELSLGERETIVRQLDDVAQQHARVLGREYLTMAHLSDEEEMGLWRANRDFWAQLGAAYYGLIGETTVAGDEDAFRRVELARSTVRLLRAYATRLKWDQFRYWPASEAVWQIMGRAYLYAYDGGFARREVSAYHGERHPSSVEQEYLKALVFQISSMDSLLPFESEIAERIIAFFLPRFSLADEPLPGYLFAVDPAGRRAPARLTEGGEQTDTTRYFSTTDAMAPLDALRTVLEGGSVPAHFDLARYRSPRIILPVVRHLSGYWSADSPKREHDRHRVRSEAAGMVGLSAILQRLRQPEDGPPPALWSVEDVSRGGVRARLPMSDRDSLHVGTLVAVRPAGGDNWLVGVVRRFARESGDHASAGVQTLSRSALPAELQSDNGVVQALILDTPDVGELVQVVLPGASFVADHDIEGSCRACSLRLEPVELVERGGEFDLACYRVLPPL